MLLERLFAETAFQKACYLIFKNRQLKQYVLLLAIEYEHSSCHWCTCLQLSMSTAAAIGDLTLTHAVSPWTG